MKKKDYILLGNLFTSFINTALNTLQISFILSMGLNIYQVINIAIQIFSSITAMYLSKHTKIAETFYNHIKLFLYIEGGINLLVAVLTLIFKTPLIVAVVSITITPFAYLQSLAINRMMSETYTQDERLEHDNKSTAYSTHIVVIAGLVGLFANKLLTGFLAYTLICLAEAVNNMFYLKQINNKK